jgi:hypothetical protein
MVYVNVLYCFLLCRVLFPKRQETLSRVSQASGNSHMFPVCQATLSSVSQASGNCHMFSMCQVTLLRGFPYVSGNCVTCQVTVSRVSKGSGKCHIFMIRHP